MPYAGYSVDNKDCSGLEVSADGLKVIAQEIGDELERPKQEAMDLLNRRRTRVTNPILREG